MKDFFARMLGFGRTLWEFIAPLLARTTATALETLLPIALEIVAELATSNAPGREKQAIAVARLEREAKAAGVTAATSLINLSVEMALQKLRGDG